LAGSAREGKGGASKNQEGPPFYPTVHAATQKGKERDRERGEGRARARGFKGVGAIEKLDRKRPEAEKT